MVKTQQTCQFSFFVRDEGEVLRSITGRFSQLLVLVATLFVLVGAIGCAGESGGSEGSSGNCSGDFRVKGRHWGRSQEARDNLRPSFVPPIVKTSLLAREP